MNKILLVGVVVVFVIVIVAVNVLILKAPKPEDKETKIENLCSNINFEMEIDCSGDRIVIDNRGVKLDDFTFRIYHGNRVEWINASDMAIFGIEDIVPIKEGERKEIDGGVSKLKVFSPYKLGIIPIVKVAGYNYCDYEIEKEFSC